jgi:hypothetical protein
MLNNIAEVDQSSQSSQGDESKSKSKVFTHDDYIDASPKENNGMVPLLMSKSLSSY